MLYSLILNIVSRLFFLTHQVKLCSHDVMFAFFLIILNVFIVYLLL